MTDRNDALPGSDIDIMRDVYMTGTQRAAFDRICAEALAAPAEGGKGEVFGYVYQFQDEEPAFEYAGDRWPNRNRHSETAVYTTPPAASVDVEAIRLALRAARDTEDGVQKIMTPIDSAGGAKGDIADAVMDPNGTCPACHQTLRTDAATQPSEGDGAVACGKCGVRQPLQHSPDCGRPAATAVVPDGCQAIVEACVITEAVTPVEADPKGTLNRLIDYHVQMNAAPAAPKGGVVGCLSDDIINALDGLSSTADELWATGDPTMSKRVSGAAQVLRTAIFAQQPAVVECDCPVGQADHASWCAISKAQDAALATGEQP